ncbi:hypothetical protein REPUB_Repub01dG0134700 [Reevesia pubescens]
MNRDNEAPPPTRDEQSVKPRRSKSREVSSRYFSPTSTPTHDPGLLQSPNKALSPFRRKPTSTTETRKHRSLEDPSSILRGLWPSSTTFSTSSSSNPKLDTLADHLGNERLKDFIERKSHEKRTNDGSFSLSKQRSHTEFSRFIENEKEISARENHRPSLGLGGSMRYTTKLGFPKRSSSSSTSSSSSSPNILPGRFSVDENALYIKSSSSQRNSSRGPTWDSNSLNPVSADRSPKINKKFTIKNAIRRANSLKVDGSATSQWALSPGRSGSPPMKSSALQLGSGDVESVHHLKLIHNCLMQWRYANAKANAEHKNMNNQVENYLLSGWNSLMKLQHSVLQKKLKLQKEKLDIKMGFILQSQMKALESWADMERQHISAISMMKECLHSVVCKVTLVEGAKLYNFQQLLLIVD